MNDTKQKRIGKTINRGKKSAKIFILCVVYGLAVPFVCIFTILLISHQNKIEKKKSKRYASTQSIYVLCAWIE